MNAGAKMFRSLMLAGILIAAISGVARAAANPATCKNDIDCIATPSCGGDVCDYSTQPPTCKPANAANVGTDGWCTATDGNGGADDCKCKAQGATCSGIYCTFTTPRATGAGGSTGAAGSTTGAAGSTTGAAGSTTGAAGSTTGAAGSTTGAAGAGGTKTSSSSGGCSVASSTSGGFAALLGLALVAGGLVRRRRRA